MHARRTLRTATRTVLSILFFAASLVACAQAPKPKELQQLDALWQNPDTRSVRDVPEARSSYEEAYQYRLRAQEAYEDGELDLAREYAIWSGLKWRNAKAISLQIKEAQRLEAANAKVAEINPELTAVNGERNKLIEQVDQAERELVTLRLKKETRERRRSALATSTASSSGPDAIELRLADEKIRQTNAARDAAVRVEADKHAAADFNRANNMLKSIVSMRATSPVPVDTITEQAERAIALFADASEKAKPGFKKAVAKRDPAARRAALLEEGARIFGDGMAMRDAGGVKIIVTSAYAAGDAELTNRGSQSINALATLSKEFDEFSLVVDLYTSEGDATENLTISQVRAQRVERKLKDAGVDAARIVSTKGHGQSRIRFPGKVLENERIEVTFR
ncbi:MAG: OmpA family protein [Myxococcota bacterium]